jgi:hypothetical protein
LIWTPQWDDRDENNKGQTGSNSTDA